MNAKYRHGRYSAPTTLQFQPSDHQYQRINSFKLEKQAIVPTMLPSNEILRLISPTSKSAIRLRSLRADMLPQSTYQLTLRPITSITSSDWP